MSDTSFDLSGKIDPEVVKALQAVQSAADPLNIPFFVVGANARDIVLLIYGIKPRRASLDLDLGVYVSNWNHFEQLVEALITRFEFQQTEKPHRFRHLDLLIDIVPYGPIAGKQQK